MNQYKFTLIFDRSDAKTLITKIMIVIHYLAFVTLDVKTTIESHNANCLFLTRFGHDWIVANRATRSKFPSFK